MRSIFLLSLFLALSLLSRAADVEFVRTWPEWRDAESFERISEYFTGKENTGVQIVRRSQPESRSGFYFLTRIRNSGDELPAAKIVLSLIKPDSPRAKVFTFPVPIKSGEHVFNLGLTGEDWASKKLHPVAWKLEVVSTDGTLLAVQKSFLWEKPDK